MFQGYNVSKCLPAAGAMVENLVLGTNRTSTEARQFDKKGVNLLRWWSMTTVQRYLTSRQVSSHYEEVSSIEYPSVAILHVDNSHVVVIVPQSDGTLWVADPMTGVKVSSYSAVLKRVSYKYMVVVNR